MPFLITNKRNGVQFSANDGETILDAALRDNRIYPYRCCSGICGACKCNLISGRVDYGEYKEFVLTEEEKKEGKLLICQAMALEDVMIDAEEIMSSKSIQIRMLPCRIAKLNRPAKDVIQMFLALPKTREFNFIAGQYIDIILKDRQRRSFSIANLPEHAAEEGLELHIRHVPDGHFTSRVFNSMKEQDLMRFEGPFGTYFLQSGPDQPIIMIAGGTGFSPIKGLFEQAVKENPNHDIHLFWGARDQQALYMDSLVHQWIKKYPNFKYTPVLSESRTDTWTGATGWVHDMVCTIYNDFSKFDVYASGPPVMINVVRDSLTARRMRLERFFFDSFDYAPQSLTYEI